jgi:hypothetical protein
MKLIDPATGQAVWDSNDPYAGPVPPAPEGRQWVRVDEPGDTNAPRRTAPGILDIGSGVQERLAFLNQTFNPVEGIGGAMRAGSRMMAPDQSYWDRISSLGEMASGVAGIAAPIAAARAIGVPAASAMMEGLLGFSPTTQAAGDTMRAAGRDIVDRLNQPGPVPVMYSNPIPGRPPLTFAEVERAMQGADESGALRLYHNSPHDFDRFSMSQIGTGEGAQAYGHGLYFAESSSVSGRGGDYWRQFFNKMPPGPERTATGAMYANKFDPEKAASQLESNVRYHADHAKPGRYGDGPEVEEGHRLLAEESQQALDMIRSGKIVGPRTYEVNINANPEDFINFDAPFEQQPPNVQKHFGYLARGERKPTGEDLARRMESNVYIQEAAQAGIPGIRYLDAGSRYTPSNLPNNPIANEARAFLDQANGDAAVALRLFNGSNPVERFATTERDEVRKVIEAAGRTATRNYVVFDENLIEIVRKYGIAGAAAMLGVSAVDVEEAIAQGAPPSQWDQLVVGPQ